MKARLSVLRDRWQHLPPRDRTLCRVLAVFLLGVFSVYGLWLPAQQRLAAAQVLYTKTLQQAAEVLQAKPTSAVKVFDQPLSIRLSESAAESGLNVQQFEMDAEVLRITLKGDALTLLNWLARSEREGAQFETLSLEKHDQSLEARLLVNTAE